MTRDTKPDIEGWRESVSPESPSPSAPRVEEKTNHDDQSHGLADGRTAAMAPLPSPATGPRRGTVRRLFRHLRVYPVLLKIRTVCFVNAALQIIGLLFVLPTTSLEKHMMMLEEGNVVVRNMWWVYASSRATQMEYHRRARRRELDGWVREETAVAWDRMLRNIGPVAGAGDGVVVASPSSGGTPNEPDYYYTWTRDAALTISTVVHEFLPGHTNTSRPIASVDYAHHHSGLITERPVYEPLIRAYVSSQAKIQQTPNPSGELWTGGLNEPKFAVDGSRFDGEWGRPQRDGPALRALALIPYAYYLLDRGWPADIQTVRSQLYDPAAVRGAGSVIKNDLEEVGGGWWLSSYDLWEEVDGHHLFTLLACLRALEAGATLATRLEDPKAAEYYLAQAKRLSEILPAFWNDDGYWQSTAHIEGHSDHQAERVDREWLDCALPLSIVHLGDDGLFAATSSETLASLRAYATSFRGLYAVNAPPPPAPPQQRWSAWLSNRDPNAGEADWTRGWAVGRYAEDMYNGIGISQGNPWYICTFSVAHAVYLAKEGFAAQGYIPLDNLTRPFWSDLLGSAFEDDPEGFWSKEKDEGRKPMETKLFRTALTQLGEVADRYLSVGRKYAPHGRMSEQMDRHDGSPVGARDLTWSYASFIEAARARDRAGG